MNAKTMNSGKKQIMLQNIRPAADCGATTST